MTFANSEYLFLLLLLAPYTAWYLLCHLRQAPSVSVSTTAPFIHMHKSFRQRLVHLPFLCRLVCLATAIVALARPQTSDDWSTRHIEGIDIMLCMDVSTSMLAEDLKPNRIEAAKQVAVEFINGRPDDNIGLTLFAGEAYTQCPMTVDHAVLLNLLNGMRADMAERGLIADGTAIGMGIANAVTRLKDSKAKSKVIILLTDGTNNCGQISPGTAADIARSFGIRVYTIGVGSNGSAPYPFRVAGQTMYQNIPVEIDTKTLKAIAARTDGEFYRAGNTGKLREVYRQIDRLEKTKMDVRKYSRRYEAFFPFLLVSVLALILEMVLRDTLLRRIP
ncbi:MAG TPA: aerotolerance regulator BatA [Prevotellaceae bacterium]|nr:aerotolerance regulator BatA [Prevotellaceae bacterium]